MTVHQLMSSTSVADGLLIDTAQRIQLSPTKYEEARKHFIALCQYIDGPESPLYNLVAECYGGGSFATGTVIASKVSQNQHDVDAVIELKVDPSARPSTILSLLFDAVNGSPGSRYHGKVRRNSRCITVTYDDGVSVDLMPIARLPGAPDKAGHLFHWRSDSAESYHKPVNPWAFARHFNESVEFDPSFVRAFEARRMLMEGVVAKAATEPLPEQTPLSEKSPRVVAIQLLKRNRDVRYRDRPGRKPPSVMLCAFALEIGPSGSGLVDELLLLANHMENRLQREIDGRRQINLVNPAYLPDVFTDRWPENVHVQQIYVNDLRHLQKQLVLLKGDRLTATEMRIILENLFGETAAGYAVERFLEASQKDVETSSMRFGCRGQVLIGAAAVAATATSVSARSNTNMGGVCLPE
jgi:hypothetical protein